jgi:hypothetical protein
MPRTVGAGAKGTRRGKIRDYLDEHGIRVSSDKKLTNKEVAVYNRLRKGKVARVLPSGGQYCPTCAKWHPSTAKYCHNCGAVLPIHRVYGHQKVKQPKGVTYV